MRGVAHVVLNPQGIRARVLETFVMLFLLALLILGMVWVASALIDNDAASMESLYGQFGQRPRFKTLEIIIEINN